MKFCLYDRRYERIILIEKCFPSALLVQEKFGMTVDIAVLPVLSKEEYLSYPSSLRGEVSGRSYLLYEIPGMIVPTYDQVIVQD